jgi:hypothetical protein
MAKPDRCSSNKDALVAFFSSFTEVTAVDDRCVVTLPIKTVDDRYQDVYLDPKLGDYVMVHDGGNSMAELFAQGIHLTDSQNAQLKTIARRYGATFNAGIFQIACAPGDSIERAVFAVAQCAALAMFEVLNHQPIIEDEPLVARTARALHKWKPDYVDIRPKLKVKGNVAEHSFDFVSLARKRGAKNVAIKLLNPSGSGARAQAERYGFLALDIQGREYDNWQRLAIVSKMDEWTESSLKLVNDLSSDVILLDSDHEERLEAVLPGKMNALTDAA